MAEATQSEMDFEIGGMYCAGCVQSVEGAVAKVDQADLGRGVAGAGYQVVEVKEENPDDKDRQLVDQRLSLIGALAFWWPLFLVEMGGMAGVPLPAFLSLERYPLG